MKLANDIKRALGRRCAGPWRAAMCAVDIKTGKMKLRDLIGLSKLAKCSVTYLTSGGNYDAKVPMSPKEAVLKSIMHAGHDKHDFARMMGFRDYSYVNAMLQNEKIPVRLLMRFAEALHLEIWELMCDSECYKVDYDSLVPTQWDQMVELNIMGWLDSKRRDEYKQEKGPGI